MAFGLPQPCCPKQGFVLRDPDFGEPRPFSAEKLTQINVVRVTCGI
jgi:hypothetical protein